MDSIRFEYRVVRLWELSLQELLAGSFHLLPLAPLTAVAEPEVPALIEHMKQRLSAEASPLVEGEIWAITGLLMGLKFEADLIKALLKDVPHMKESTLYQSILAEGFQRGIERGIEQGIERGIEREKRHVVLLATQRLGPPDAETALALGNVRSEEQLEGLITRLLTARSWPELLF